MVSVSFISILLGALVIALTVSWFIYRSLLNAKISQAQEQYDVLEEKLTDVTMRCKELETKGMRFQYESSAVFKKMTAKRQSLEKYCRGIEKDNIDLCSKNADIARKITQLHKVKQGEINELVKKVKSVPANGAVATTSKQEIQHLKHTVDRLESLVINETTNYKDQINQLESQIIQIQPIDVLQSATTVEPDDLTEINGIGANLSEFLREFGIINFNQLANMSDEELVRLSDELGDFGDRVVRDKWVEQARKLSGTHS